MANQMTKNELNKKATVAGAFFVFMQLFVRGITFLITPIYTRLVSTAQYGEIRVYESWLLIVVPLLSLSLYRSVERAKFDYPDKFDEYVGSVLSLSYIVIALCYAIATIFFRKYIMAFCEMDVLMYVFMILYTFAYSATLFFQRREKQVLRYKNSVIITACMMIPATLFSVLLLYWGNVTSRQSQLVDLRVIGYYVPQVIGGLFVAFLMVKQGGFKIKKEYWKYALCFSVPLIPETLSIQIMNQADKIMIQKLVDDESVGIFALATTVSFIIWIIEDAVWGAWLPWLYEKISRNEIEDIQKPWYTIVFAFGYISWMLVALAPELIIVLGGGKYHDAIFLVAPMVTGTLFRFFSNAFTSIENYQKKTAYCAFGTVAAMIINIVLNAICITHIGYQTAAYTTAISYFILLVLQGFLEKKVCGMRCVSLLKMVLLSVVFFAINVATNYLFELSMFIRFGVIILVTSVVAYVLWPYLKILLKQFRGKGKEKC